MVRAPATEMWKLLHDPARSIEWWVGVGRGTPTDGGATFYPDAWPGIAMPTRFATGAGGRRIVVNYLITDDVYTWTLEPHRGGCRVGVRVEVPEGGQSRLGTRRTEVLASLARLTAVAERAARPDRGGR